MSGDVSKEKQLADHQPSINANPSSGQTFEGGISGQPNAEAHGAYAFCALGCLALLDHPSRSIPR